MKLIRWRNSKNNSPNVNVLQNTSIEILQSDAYNASTLPSNSHVSSEWDADYTGVDDFFKNSHLENPPADYTWEITVVHLLKSKMNSCLSMCSKMIMQGSMNVKMQTWHSNPVSLCEDLNARCISMQTHKCAEDSHKTMIHSIHRYQKRVELLKQRQIKDEKSTARMDCKQLEQITHGYGGIYRDDGPCDPLNSITSHFNHAAQPQTIINTTGNIWMLSISLGWMQQLEATWGCLEAKGTETATIWAALIMQGQKKRL